MRETLSSQFCCLRSIWCAALLVREGIWAGAVSSAGGRRSMKQGAESPLVTTGLEQFRDAATWQAVITNLTSSAAAYEVHGFGGGSLPRPVACSQLDLKQTCSPGPCFWRSASLRQCMGGSACRDATHCIITGATVGEVRGLASASDSRLLM